MSLKDRIAERLQQRKEYNEVLSQARERDKQAEQDFLAAFRERARLVIEPVFQEVASVITDGSVGIKEQDDRISLAVISSSALSFIADYRLKRVLVIQSDAISTKHHPQVQLQTEEISREKVEEFVSAFVDRVFPDPRKP